MYRKNVLILIAGKMQKTTCRRSRQQVNTSQRKILNQVGFVRISSKTCNKKTSKLANSYGQQRKKGNPATISTVNQSTARGITCGIL